MYSGYARRVQEAANGLLPWGCRAGRHSPPHLLDLFCKPLLDRWCRTLQRPQNHPPPHSPPPGSSAERAKGPIQDTYPMPQPAWALPPGPPAHPSSSASWAFPGGCPTAEFCPTTLPASRLRAASAQGPLLANAGCAPLCRQELVQEWLDPVAALRAILSSHLALQLPCGLPTTLLTLKHPPEECVCMYINNECDIKGKGTRCSVHSRTPTRAVPF